MMSEQEIIHMQIDELQQELDKAVEDVVGKILERLAREFGAKLRE